MIEGWISAFPDRADVMLKLTKFVCWAIDILSGNCLPFGSQTAPIKGTQGAVKSSDTESYAR